jgi:pantoate--beta-alanine ligase
MKVFSEAKMLNSYLFSLKKDKNISVGYVPTMGALHQGHISLIQSCIAKSDISIASIYVNPTQFNNQEDFDKYPNTISQDLEMLEKAGCDIVFVPKFDQVYGNEAIHRVYDLDGLDLVLEGANRPGHFQGVCNVVHRLLDIVQPDFLFLGQKDFQQTVVLKKLLNIINSPVEVVVCPIVREENGLAMSSRNVRLSEKGRNKAAFISKTLQRIKNSRNLPLSSVLEKERAFLNTEPSAYLDYLEMVDGRTLKSISDWDESDFMVVLIVVIYEGVRLLDNEVLA